jgi:hypothetical protein
MSQEVAQSVDMTDMSRRPKLGAERTAASDYMFAVAPILSLMTETDSQPESLLPQ